MASSVFSSDRVFCADYRKMHKRKILLTKDFRPVSEIGVETLRKCLPPDQRGNVKGTDQLCRNCFTHFARKVSDFEQSEMPASEGSPESDPYVHPPDVIEEINEYISSEGISVTPLKPKRSSVESYAKRKYSEIQSELGKKTGRKIETAFGVAMPGTSSSDCQSCDDWVENIRIALQASTSMQERCRLLTLVPASWTESKVLDMIPEATRYMVRKARRIRQEKHAWAAPDAYQGHPLSKENLQSALEYFTNDELDCSVQSPRSKDVVQVVQEGTKVTKTKRYMTRSIRETFQIFRAAHPEVKVSATKFYSMRPKWVSISPCREECCCSYCANFELCIVAVNNISDSPVTADELMAMCLCQVRHEDCFLGDCLSCPGKEALTAESLHISADEGQAEIALWETGGLVKKVMPIQSFIGLVRHWTVTYICHEHIRTTQRLAIRREKLTVQPGGVVFHFDFAENWTVILPNEVQSYHWKKTQVSIFTCVVTASAKTYSYAVVSDDTRHDTAAALCSIGRIDECMDENGPIYGRAVYVSDGASAHFKNRFQLHEMKKNDALKKWVFSAPGHGKNACDGIGGVVKHAATLHNLRSPATQSIQNGSDLVRTLNEKIPGVRLLFLSSTHTDAFRTMKKEEWKSVRPVQGLRSSFVWEKCESDQPSRVTLSKMDKRT